MHLILAGKIRDFSIGIGAHEPATLLANENPTLLAKS